MADFEEYDFYFFVNLDRDSLTKTDVKNPDKSILLWIGEENGCFPHQMIGKYNWIFKCHLREETPSKNLYALPLGFPSGFNPDGYIPIRNRAYNVFFSGNLNNNRVPFYFSFFSTPFRFFLKSRKLMHLLINRYTKSFILRLKHKFHTFSESIITFTNGFAKGFSREEYCKIIHDSKIVLSPLGFYSAECFRTYEALSAGCIVISEKLPDDEFYKDSPIIQLENWHDIKNVVEGLLMDEKRLERLSIESKKWYDEHLSPRAVAEYIMSKIHQAD